MIFSPTDILIPNVPDLTKWSVIACDQFSSERAYWERVDRTVGDSPSALRMIVPEAYLDDEGIEEYTLGVGRVAEEYLNRGLFTERQNCFVYTLRTLRDGRIRRGLVGALNLDHYDFTGAQSKISATEETVPSRLPTRSKARLGSPLEIPHIMALIDDRARTCVERLGQMKLPTLYDFELMENSGRLTGYLVEGQVAESVAASVARV
ncbi:MAG: DUF1015 domain-containing protein [Clostridiales bacterium]|nr:DUF1015 domain-containing protein [Clostridiales bacterium]